jgi:hypothetical protein
VIADRPSAWPETQRAFRSAYEREPATLPRRSVWWRFIAPRAAPPLGPDVFVTGGFSLAWILGRLARRRMMNQSPVLAVWPVDAEPGDPVAVIFEVTPQPAGAEGDGVLVGEMAMNAALCVELPSGVVLWPTYNPRRPEWGEPRR